VRAARPQRRVVTRGIVEGRSVRGGAPPPPNGPPAPSEGEGEHLIGTHATVGNWKPHRYTHHDGRRQVEYRCKTLYRRCLNL